MKRLIRVENRAFNSDILASGNRPSWLYCKEIGHLTVKTLTRSISLQDLELYAEARIYKKAIRDLVQLKPWAPTGKGKGGHLTPLED